MGVMCIFLCSSIRSLISLLNYPAFSMMICFTRLSILCVIPSSAVKVEHIVKVEHNMFY